MSSYSSLTISPRKDYLLSGCVTLLLVYQVNFIFLLFPFKATDKPVPTLFSSLVPSGHEPNARLWQGHCISCPSPTHHAQWDISAEMTHKIKTLFPCSGICLAYSIHWRSLFIKSKLLKRLTNLSQSPDHSVLWCVLFLCMHGVPCVCFNGNVFWGQNLLFTAFLLTFPVNTKLVENEALRSKVVALFWQWQS